MYYDTKGIDDILKCSFCSARLVGVVKLVPECVSSICGDCYEALSETLDESSRFKCRACAGEHEMPKHGLKDNASLLKLLGLQRNAKPLGHEARALRSLLDELREKIAELESRDETRSIDSYCDSLELQVNLAAESAVKHLVKIQEELLEEIEAYRRLLKEPDSSKRPDRGGDESTHAEANVSSEELGELSREVDAFSKHWEGFFSEMSRLADDSELREAQEQTRDLIDQATELEQILDCELFKCQFLRFKENGFFCTMRHHLGTLHFDAFHLQIKERLLHSLNGHDSDVNQVLFLREGNLASCSSDNSIKVWSVRDGEMLYELSGHLESVVSLAQLGNGWLASGSEDTTIKIWNLEAKQLVRTLEGHGEVVTSLRALSNGNLASCAWDDTIKIWNLLADDGAELIATMRGHGMKHSQSRLGLMKNGFLVTCSGDVSCSNELGVIRIWDPESGQLARSISTNSPSAHTRSLAILSNDRIAVGFSDGRIKIVDLADVSEIQILESCHEDGVWSLLAMPNGLLLSGGTSSDPTIKIWDPFNAKLIRTLSDEHSSYVSSLSVSADGKILASGSDDTTIRIWCLFD